MSEQLILVRHGETMHNVAGIAQGWGDSELSDRGRKQVASLAERLKTIGADAIYSSPLQRAMTTAQAIAEATGLTIQTLDGLREMNYGRWEGQRFVEVRKTDEEHYQRWISEDEYPCPEGESHAQVARRVREALQHVNGVKRAVVVTHGTAIRIATTALLDLPLSASRNFAQDNAAMNVFVRRGNHWVMKLWNDTAHCS
jgi:broad specificity phosphatase PhoE